MKLILRICVVFTLVSYFLLNTFAEQLLQFQILGSVVIILASFTGIFFMVYLLVFWFKSKFIHVVWKIVWLIVWLFSYHFIGPVIFYIVVYEKGMFLKNNNGV